LASTGMSIRLQTECRSPRRSTPAGPRPRARGDPPAASPPQPRRLY
jgi:hypothetical protein